jgi:hypothetical protein
MSVLATKFMIVVDATSEEYIQHVNKQQQQLLLHCNVNNVNFDAL